MQTCGFHDKLQVQNVKEIISLVIAIVNRQGAYDPLNNYDVILVYLNFITGLVVADKTVKIFRITGKIRLLLTRAEHDTNLSSQRTMYICNSLRILL